MEIAALDSEIEDAFAFCSAASKADKSSACTVFVAKIAKKALKTHVFRTFLDNL
jgi:hypothetical protein